MPNNVYYVFDDKLCKYEGMTKEQIYNAIAEATGTTPVNVDDGFITTIVETHNNRSMHLWKGTSAEYAALPSHDPDTYYIISDDTTLDDLEAAVADMDHRIDNLVSSLFWCDDNTTADEIAEAVNNNRLPIYFYVFPPIGSIPSYTVAYMYEGTNTLGHYLFSRLRNNIVYYADLNPNTNSWSRSSFNLQRKIVTEEVNLLAANWSSGKNTATVTNDPTQYSTVFLVDSDDEREYVSDTSKNTRISGMTSSTIEISSNSATGNHKIKMVMIP